MNKHKILNRIIYVIKTTVSYILWFFVAFSIFIPFIENKFGSEIRIYYLTLPIIMTVVILLFDLLNDENEFDPFKPGLVVFGSFLLCVTLCFIYEYALLALILIAISTFLSLIYAVFMLTRKNRSKLSKKKVIKMRLSKIFDVSEYIFGFFGIVFILLATINGMLLPHFIHNNNLISENYNDYFYSNIDTLKKFDEAEWKNLSYDEKVDVLQKLADVEQCRLGIPDKMTVVTDKTSELVLAHYREKTHTITIDSESVDKYGPWKLMKAVCHEAFHGYQYRLVSLYFDTSDEERNLQIFDDAKKYYDELKDYIDIEEDFEMYFNQLCEEDAREHSVEATSEYYRLIKKYLKSK